MGGRTKALDSASWMVLGGLALTGCGASEHVAMDASPMDASTMDASSVDASTMDASSVDASTMDAMAVDAATPDAFVAETGVTDAFVPDAGPVGIPFGPFALYAGWTTFEYGPAPFTLTLNAMDPTTIVASLTAAHDAGVHLVLAMTGGSHALYITGGAFDRAKWDARMMAFDTPEIRAAIAARVSDGTILAASVMDEPDHVSWGGVVDGAEIDSMAAAVEAIFPTLPTATVVQLDWEPTYVYTNLEYLIRQFSYDLFAHQGPNMPGAYRDAAIAQAATQHVGVIFSMNILDGGARVAGCPTPATGGPGTYGENCRMTPTEVALAADALTALGACGLLMWESDAAYFGDPAHVEAFTSAASLLAGRPRAFCRP